jgi:type II secretory pathway pseudopilin PulG
MRAGEQGVTLVELVVAMAISFVLLGATLTTFNQFNQNIHDNDTRNDSAELARRSLDVQARQLRNLAKRVSSPVIDTIGPYDLIFQTADPSRTWVRYCLDTSTAPASTARGRLWTGELAVPSAAAGTPVTAQMRAACPGSGWTTTRVVADYVSNRRNGLDRPLFSYTCTSGTTCTSSAATYDQVVNISAQTLIDTTPGVAPAELRVASGVYLRNQNQPPVAGFVASPSATRTVELNAANSSDFEGRTLDYYWFKDTMPAAARIDCSQPTITGNLAPKTLWGSAGFIGVGVVLAYTFPLADGLLTRNIGLVVCDPGDRYDSVGIPPEATVAVQIPT